MTSQINTNSIDSNYPVPGQNNDSQGFRNNFAAIKTNLNTAASEITDLENKVVLKAALNNSVLNNDMANVLISNASTSGFRATTYNLGNALSGTVIVSVNQSDVQYGTVAGNTVLQFNDWAPTNTQSNVVVRLTYSNINASVSLPNAAVSSNNNFGVTLLENYANVAGTATLTSPAHANIVELRFSSLDCGNTITVEPINRPYKATQLVTRNVIPTGVPGDVSGDISVSETIAPTTVTSTTGTGNILTVTTTAGYYIDMPIVFTGNTDSSNSNIVAGTTYFVSNVANSTAFNISASIGGSQFDVGNSTVDFAANPVGYLYICTNTFDSNIELKNASTTNATGNIITLNNTSNIVVNAPIVFTGTTFGGLTANTTYYITYISSPNIAVSTSRVNGVAGPNLALSTANGSANATVYIGNDIWKRVTLTNW
jgi:hypothetical protein